MVLRIVILLLFIYAGGIACESHNNRKIPEGMVLVPASEFIMGSNGKSEKGIPEKYGIPDKWFVDEHPERKVYLDSFYIDKYEVTMGEYKKFIDDTAYKVPPDWKDNNFPKGQADYPVVLVDLYDAMAYAKWAGKRIPTEAEWEKAARGTKGRIYPWGNKFDGSKANLSLSVNKEASPKRVGSFKGGVSPYGVHDMTGNVWEWTVSYYQPYPGNSFKKKSFGKTYVVARGFSWHGLGHFPDETYHDIVSHMSRTSYRDETLPHTLNTDLGFRCVKDVE